ncbi:endonuclease/exonuclease/phosphatase (EEP) superfamily protein YafD [Pseudorhizobium tarimense]|uniref:Endonuclease/exonuclease/phosphatase (EEP) superfamily protein YafD n=1 Tax=Pseudorhizobium tarimense TaxID=1079109 RepID=A0ABV2H789_9HYPH|nr:endonuclease/exonuclease/phosphatase family protein [Pseudorhizobium tarimense]MCJ8519366.1 endonuclease/exonuclease/phosphatase family protein [Pseudorhizobium tarimense]
MREFLSVAICVIVSLVLFAMGTRFVSDIWIFATIHSLQLHLSIACSLALLAALLLRRGILPFALLLVSLSFLEHSIWMSRQFAQEPNPAAPVASLRLMSFNILMDNLENGPAIRDLILSSGADVVNVMEAEPLRPHLQELATVYPYRIGCGELTRGCDLMMLSKLPLAKRTIASLSDIFAERLMLAQVAVSEQPLYLAAIHTTKPYFDGFQAHELANAAELLNGLQGPVILSGDFNASSISPNVRRFLRQTGLRSADYEPATWPTELGWAGVAIDHIFVRPPLAISSLQRLPDSLGSNHYGLVAQIAVPQD